MGLLNSNLSEKALADSTVDDYFASERLITDSEATGAAFDLALQDSAVGLIARSGSELPGKIAGALGTVAKYSAGAIAGPGGYEAAEKFINRFGVDLSSGVADLENSGAKPLLPEEANKLYPGMDEPFREPINPYIAKLRFDQQMEKQQLQYKMAMGPDNNWSKTKMVGAGIAAHLLDPVEFGAGALVGWGVGGAAARGMLGATAERVATAAAGEGATLGTRLAYDAIEGAGGALIENVGQEIGQKIVEAGENVVDVRTNYEIATDVLIGSVAAFGMQAGPKSIARGFDLSLEGTKRWMRETSPEADLPVGRHIVSSSMQGTLPDVTPMKKALALETSVDPKLVNYDYAPMQTPKGKTFFVATRDAADDAPRVPLGDDFGFGTHLTDHPGVANAAGARSMADGVGTVSEVMIDDLNPIRLEQPLPAMLHIPIRDAMEDFYDRKVIDFDSMPARDILQTMRDAVDAGLLPEESLSKVQKAMQDAGYDSMVSDGKLRLGEEHTPHNHVTLFDDTKIQVTKTNKANGELRRNPTENELDEMKMRAENPARFLDSKPTTDLVKQELSEIDVPSMDRDFAKATENDLLDIESLKQQGDIPEAEFREVQDAIKKVYADAQDQHKILKAFKLCATRTA